MDIILTDKLCQSYKKIFSRQGKQMKKLLQTIFYRDIFLYVFAPSRYWLLLLS